MDIHSQYFYFNKKLQLLLATPRAALTLLSCSPNFPSASIIQYTHAKHEPILKYKVMSRDNHAKHASSRTEVPGQRLSVNIKRKLGVHFSKVPKTFGAQKAPENDFWCFSTHMNISDPEKVASFSPKC